MIDDSLLLRLKEIGMSEYEAKVYVTLLALRVACAREIHEQTKIPRGRVYETITSLMQKGFIFSIGKSPVRYAPVDVNLTFERLKRNSMISLDNLGQGLKNLESEIPKSLTQVYELRTDWTQENQIRMMLHRAKSEIIFLCNDEGCISGFSAEISRAAKRIPVYLVVGKPEIAKTAPIKCYVGGTDIAASVFHHEAGESVAISMKLFLMVDRRESLTIMEENEKRVGLLFSPDIFAGYMSRKIIQEIQQITPVRKGCTKAGAPGSRIRTPITRK
jgi:Predicted transcriptional regulators